MICVVGLLLVAALPRHRELLQVSLAIRTPWDNLVTQALATWYLVLQLLQPFALNVDPRLAVFHTWELRWVVALYGDAVVPFTWANVTSGGVSGSWS